MSSRKPDADDGREALDPYVAPRAALVGRLGNVRGRSLAFVYAAAVLTGAVNRAAEKWANPSFHQAAKLGAYVASAIGFAVILSWVYLAWSTVPPSYRGKLTPRAAALGLVWPLYNLYWGFVVNIALCDSLNAALERRGSDVRAPRVLGIVANASWLVFAPLILVGGRFEHADVASSVVRGGLWCAYMIMVDHARGEVAAMGDRLPLPPRSLGRLQEEGGTSYGVVVAAVAIVILFLAIWQVLQSGTTPLPAGQ